MDKSTPAPIGGVGNGAGLPPLPPRHPGPRLSSFHLDFMNTSSACPSQPSPNSNQSIEKLSNDACLMPDVSPRNVNYYRVNSRIPSLDNNFDCHLRFMESRNHPPLSDEIEKNVLCMDNIVEKFNPGDSSADPSLRGSSRSALPPVQGFADVAFDSSENLHTRHQRSHTVDGSTLFRHILVSSGEGASNMIWRKATSDAKLAEMALVDPKRAKRILANRQSAARSKQRKVRYIQELENKVKTLEVETTKLSAQLTVFKGDTAGLAAENSELKLRVQTMEQHFHLQDALNDALREEITHLRMVMAQRTATNRGLVNSVVLPSLRDAQDLQAMQPPHTAHQHQPFLPLSEHQQQLQAHQAQQQEQILRPALNDNAVNFNNLHGQK